MLNDLQKLFGDAVIEGKTHMALLQSLDKNYCDEEARARLAIYQNNFYASLTEHLLETFPTVVKLLGEDFFRALSREFIKANPPQSPCVDVYGESFSRFIASFPPLADYPYIIDVAKLNYFQHRAWYAKESPSLSPDDFASFDIQTLSASRIELDASLSLLQSPFAVYSIWEENQKDAPGEVQAKHSETVLVYRELPAYHIHTQLIDEGFYTFLKNLKDQHNLADALNSASEVDPDFNASNAINSLICSGLSIGASE